MKKNNNGFKAYENPTYEYIHINNQKVRIDISWSNDFSFKLSFNFRNILYQITLDPIKNEQFIFSFDAINFEKIEINEIDKKIIVDRLNDILDYYFN